MKPANENNPKHELLALMERLADSHQRIANELLAASNAANAIMAYIADNRHVLVKEIV